MMSSEHYTNQFRAYAGYIKRFASQSIYEYDDAFNAIKTHRLPLHARVERHLFSA